MMIYAPAMLREALAVALEDKLGGKPIAEFYRGHGRSHSKTSGSGWSGDHWVPDMPDAECELRRDLDALQHISADCPRDQWRKIVAATADRHLGSDSGREIALAWSLGGTVFGVTFPKPTGEFTVADFEACWRDACRNPHFGIGTVFHFAKENGWNSSRRHWGLGRAQRPGKPLSAKALQVREAGLAMPRQNPNLERQVWFRQVLRATRRPDLLSVAFVIAVSINIGPGFAWRTFEDIADLLGWSRGPKGEGFRRVSRAVRDLALLGFIVRSPGNERGAHGRIGPSFALTFPDAMTWEACIASYQNEFGGPSARRHSVAATSAAQGPCKPKGAVQTATKSGGSQATGNDVDPHQSMPVQTTPNMDRHQHMSVHLNMKVDAGREGESGSHAQAGQVAGAGRVPVDSPPDQPLPDAASIDAHVGDPAVRWTPENFWGPAKVVTDAAHD
jgi:hypothetical protein